MVHVKKPSLVKWARGGERAVVVSASLVLQLGNRIAKRFWLKGPRSDFFSCISLTCSSASFPLDGPRDPALLTWLLSQNLLSRIDPPGAQPGICLRQPLVLFGSAEGSLSLGSFQHWPGGSPRCRGPREERVLCHSGSSPRPDRLRASPEGTCLNASPVESILHGSPPSHFPNYFPNVGFPEAVWPLCQAVFPAEAGAHVQRAAGGAPPGGVLTRLLSAFQTGT